MYPTSCTNTYHDISGLVNYGMVKNEKDLNISRMEHKFFMKHKISQSMPQMVHFEILKTYIGFLPSF